MTTAQDVIKEASKHLGYVEGPRKDNKFGAWFGANHQPWCAMFASYCLAAAGGRTLIAGAQTSKGFSSCGYGIKFFKKKKAWFAVKDAVPGDLVFFDWDHDGVQDHVGILVKNNPRKKQVVTIEGNTSDTSHSNGGTVQKKVRNYSNIIGVGRPAYAKPAPVVVKATPPVPTTAPTAA